jgi:hypothetical protein
MRGGTDLDSALDFMSGIIGGSGDGVDRVDFPISDPDLKYQYTKAFLSVYHADKKLPITTYDEIDGLLKYSDSQLLPSNAYHVGQRKLILNEIQFLTTIPQDMSPLIVYAGAAPSNKGALLASLFPRLKFLLIDPAKFDIRPYEDVVVHHLDVADSNIVEKASAALDSANICTVRTYMTGALALELGKKYPGKIYFISDIRTNMIEKGPTTLDILWNSAQQIQWVYLMNPVSSMLKFRVPFFNESAETLQKYYELSQTGQYKEAFDFAAKYVDLRTFTARSFKFFDGELYLQPWAPTFSAESRLVFKGIPSIREYNIKEYEDRFFYYNNILRNYQLYKNPNADRKIGFDYCADCALENKIWTDYCKSIGRKDVSKYVKILSQVTSRSLAKNNHGKMFGSLPIHVIEQKFREVDRY